MKYIISWAMLFGWSERPDQQTSQESVKAHARKKARWKQVGKNSGKEFGNETDGAVFINSNYTPVCIFAEKP